MEQDQTAKLNQTLQELLSKPGNIGYEEQNLLKQLVKEHPQSGLLQALYASVVNRAALKQAGIYYNSAALYKIAHSPASLPEVNEEQLIFSSAPVAVLPAEASALPETEEQIIPAENYTETEVAADAEEHNIKYEPLITATEALEEPEEVNLTKPVSADLPAENLPWAEEQDIPEATAVEDTETQAALSAGQEENAVESGPIAEMPYDIAESDEHLPVEIIETEDADLNELAMPEYNSEVPETYSSEPVITHEPPVAPVSADEDDEIYEEIVGIEDISFTPVNKPLATVLATEQVAEATAEIMAEDNAPEQRPDTQPVAVLEEQEVAEEPEALLEEEALTAATQEAAEPEIMATEPQPEEKFTGAQETEEDNETVPVTEKTVEPVIVEEETQTHPEKIETETPETAEAEETLLTSADDEDEQEDEAEYKEALADQEDDSQSADGGEPAPVEEETSANFEPHFEEQQNDADNAVEELPADEPEQAGELKETAQVIVKPPEPALVAAENMPAEPAVPKAADITEKLIIENIAATDYFIFDRAFRDRNPANAGKEKVTPVQEAAPQPAAVASTPAVEESSDVSKYHDEKMPYSFMWWLDKTRREHAGIYQPYIQSQPSVQPVVQPVKVDDSLQHQYIESIMQQTPVEGFEADHTQTVNPATRDKEHKIIERFIQEEPQIKPPSSEKLGSENKAKRSAEDQDELITETLARIYADQMLYAKAIATYKKLMLKFPEKSTYFADQITRLQQKIS
jgi:hypothetical protein